MIPKVLVFTSGVLEQTPLHKAIVLDLLEDSRVGVVIREPTASPALIHWLDDIIEHARASVIVHSKTPRFETLLETHPHCGLHLPANSDPMVWRHRISGPFGQSTHDLTQVHSAFQNKVDYVTLSPVFPSISKPGDSRQTISLDLLQNASAQGPLFALGGITPVNARALHHTGTHGVAVLGSIFEHGHPVDAFF